MKSDSHDTAPLNNCHLRRVGAVILGFSVISVLAMLLPIQNWIVPRVHYLPIHTLMELVSVFAAFLVFATIWHTPTREVSGSLVFLAIALLASGWLDIAHTLSLSGMPDFITPSSPGKSMWFWLAARFMVASNLLVFSFFPNFPPFFKMKRLLILAVYSAINLLIFWIIIFYEADLPVTFIEGKGVTPFKIVAEYAIVVIFSVAAWRIFLLAKRSRDETMALLFGAAFTALLSELLITDYTVSNSAQHILAHLLKIATYVLVYRALFVGSIRKPYQKLADQTQALIAANAILRTQALALESTTTPVMVTDPQGNLTWRNPASAMLWSSLSPQDAGKLNIFSRPLTPDPQQANEIRSTLMSGRAWSGLVEIQDSHGNQFMMDRTITPLRNEQGLVEGYVSVSENRTESLRALSRHKRVLETALDGFFIANFEGVLIETNAAYAKMLGYTESELIGMHITQLSAVSESREINARIGKFADVVHDQFETKLRHKGERTVDVEISVATDSDTQQIFVFVRDITERKQTQQTRRALERQLLQAQKMQALGQLTGGIAHDFNNILTSVVGYSNLALTRFVPDKQSKLASYLKEVIKASERARQLIEKMLTFARTERNANVSTIQPSVIIKDVISMMQPSIPSNIQLIAEINSQSQIQIDEGELNQVLVNLVINARDAISGSGKITISTRAIEISGQEYSVDQQLILAGHYLSVEIFDTGQGIAPEHMPHLFEPFFTTKAVGKGTGLGLPMVQGIVRRADGYVKVESSPGKGCRFQLLFPMHQPLLELPAFQPIQLQAKTGTGQRIWVVDDEPAIVSYLYECLTHAGYHVKCFIHPSDVLRAFQDDMDGLDLLITDQTMPDMSGRELAKQIHVKRPDLPIVLCSGNGPHVNTAELKTEGIRYVFSKPLHIESFLAVLSNETSSQA